MAESWTELPFEEAIAYLKGLRPTPKDVYDAMSAEAQQTAFFASRVYKLEVLQSMLEDLQSVIQDGGTISDFIARFADSGLSENHLETIFRTNVQSAYGAGSWDLLTDSDISDAIYGWEYHTVGDDRVREEHAALEGVIFALGEGDEFYPPWDFNCRCSASAVTQSEAQEAGVGAAQVPESSRQALGETAFSSPALGYDYSPDMGGYDVGLIAAFNNDQEANQ